MRTIRCSTRAAMVLFSVCTLAAAVRPCAAEDQSRMQKRQTDQSVNRGQSDQFSFSSKFLSPEEKARLESTKNRRVEDLNKRSSEGFKIQVQPRPETAGTNRYSPVQGSIKTSDQMSELNRR